MDFKYPYTDYHELNLDWFLSEFKNLTETWARTQQDWISMQEYIRDYFDNLNVQTEIDNKIEAMIQDGTFGAIVEPFVTAALPAMVAGQLPDVVAAQIGAVVAAQIGAVVAGQLPAIAAQAAADEVSAWLVAHIDPDTGYVIDDSLTISQAAADAKTVGDYVSFFMKFYNRVLDVQSPNMADPDQFTEGYIKYKSGTEAANANYFYTGHISVNAGDVIKCNHTMRYITAYTNNVAVETSGADSVTQYTVPADIDSIIITGPINKINDYMVVSGAAADTTFIPFGPAGSYISGNQIKRYDPDNWQNRNYINLQDAQYGNMSKIAIKDFVATEKTSNNIFDVFTITPDTITYRDNTTASSGIYNSSAEIPVSAGDTLYFGNNGSANNVRFLCAFVSGVATVVYGAENISSYTVPETVTSIIVTYNKELTKFHINVGSLEAYEPYIDNYVEIENALAGDGNVLNGKKWWACGDSFTEWSTDQYTPGEIPNIDGLAHYKTYPYWIAKRNRGLTVYNYAVSGQTMAMPADPGDFTNAFSNGKYQNIPEDVDYITLYFGINDSHHRPGSSGGDGEDNEGVIPLGTIDDATTVTFYGAWNVVLEYLITNHPWAKIGIIITNGAETEDYPNAEIQLAKKWGIPYLDLNGDYKLPLMLRCNGKSDTSETAVNIRKSQQWASPTAPVNGHPNTNAHKFESTFIENWLRSI